MTLSVEGLGRKLLDEVQEVSLSEVSEKKTRIVEDQLYFNTRKLIRALSYCKNTGVIVYKRMS